MAVIRADNDSAALDFSDRKTYLYAMVSGERDSLALSTAGWRAIIAECRKRRRRNVLVEHRFPNDLSVTEMFELMNALAAMPVAGLKIGYLERLAKRNELDLFAEDVAVNRGIQGRVFNDVKEAEEWFAQP